MKKKSIKSNSSHQLSHEFLADFFHPDDKAVVKKYKKEIWNELKEAAENIPAPLRSKLQKISIALGFPVEEGEPNYENHKAHQDIQVAILNELRDEWHLIEDIKYEHRYLESRIAPDANEPPSEILYAVISYYPSNFIESGETKKQIKKPKSENIILHLTKEGDLYREPKDKYCYSMSEQAERQKILRWFIDQSKITKNFIRTNYAASALEKDDESLRREIGKINQNVLNRLKIGRKTKIKTRKGEKERIVDGLIDSKQDSGYRLNPKVKIIPD